MSSTIPAITAEENRVILRGELATDVIHDIAWSDTPGFEEFQELFEIVSGHHLGNPDEDYYQGVTWTALIRRKTDKRLFGFAYWQPVAKNAESLVESNAEEHGIEVEYDEDYDVVGGQVYVFTPVREFTLKGYEALSPEAGGE
jgi:hypothetical protein